MTKDPFHRFVTRLRCLSTLRIAVTLRVAAALSIVAMLSVAVSAVHAQGVHRSEEIDQDTAPVPGLDHIPVAVSNLELAADRYREIGFTLKPGKPHENGIRNQHVKFADGTEIELITAAEARDAVTTTYIRHLEQGDGPAFAVFYAPDPDVVSRRLDSLQLLYSRTGRFLTFPPTDRLHYIFFGPRNHSPTDRPEHFEHANGAEALIGLWIAGDSLEREEEIFVGLGARLSDEDVLSPFVSSGRVARFPEAEVLILPVDRELVQGRRIIGATLRTRSLEELQRVLAGGPWDAIAPVVTMEGRSIFLPPDITHGIWLEFREQR